MNSIKNLLLAYFLLSLPLLSFSQGWERAYPNLGYFVDIIQTSDENYTAFSNTIFPNWPRITMVRVDSEGDILWTSTIGPDSVFSSVFSGIATNNEDGYIIGGRWVHRDSFTNILGQALLVRTDQMGNPLWFRRYGAPDAQETIYQVINCSDGGYAFLMNVFRNIPGSDEKEEFLVRVNEQGDVLWQTLVQDSSTTNIGRTLLQLPDSSFVMTTRKLDGTMNTVKTNKNGQILWRQQVPAGPIANQDFFIHEIHHLENGEFRLIGGAHSVNPPTNNGSTVLGFYDDIYIVHLDAMGQKIDEQIIDHQNNWQHANSAHFDSDGTLTIGGSYLEANRPFEETIPFFARIDSSGQFLFHQTYPNFPEDDLFIDKLLSTIAGGFMLMVTGSGSEAYLINTDEQGFSLTSVLSGTLFNDEDDNCAIDPGEAGLANWMVQLSGDAEGFALTDSSGRYAFRVDSGQYTIKVLPLNDYWSLNCFDSINQTVNSFDTIETDIPVFPLVECPYLEVDLSTPFLRRCFETSYFVQYCNNGTVDAPDTYVEILLDSFLVFQSANVPVTQIDSNLYRFELDTVAAGICGQFQFSVLTDCSAELGQTHCVEAQIFPDTICSISPSWSGASIRAEGQCLGDSVRFVLRNVGTATTSFPLDYMVIIDDVILRQNSFSLAAGDSTVIFQEISGQTARLQAQQEAFHPLDNHPSVSIEGCGANGVLVSLGFITQFPQDDSYPTIDIDCQQNRGAFDPNDKQGFPTGYANQRYIEPNTDLEYLIRFQNTGTDTAFRVVILDTLQEGLDITSLRLGVASHDYQLEILGNNILQFTFDNILLPDSNINEAASHGFVKFTIDQTKDNPLGLRIENEAAIYFDFNAPIITNTTFHTVQEEFITVSIDPQPLAAAPQVLVRPNPMGNSAVLELDGVGYEQLEFRLYDSSGKLLRQSKFSGNQYEIQRANLTEGFYLFQILSQQQMISSGKLIVH